MDQLVFLAGGTFIAVVYMLSPVKLMEKLMALIEELGNSSAPIKGVKQKVRSYYVRGVK